MYTVQYTFGTKGETNFDGKLVIEKPNEIAPTCRFLTCDNRLPIVIAVNDESRHQSTPHM